MQADQNSTGASTYVAESSNFRASDLQVSAVTTTGSATRAFSMAHQMGLANIKMAGATAAVSKETLTLSANTTTEQYSSSTTNNAFYALDEFVTNLPYKVGTRNTSGLCCYFIVNPSKSYTFSTSYKYGDSDTYRQWNNFTVSSSSNAIASSKYKEITTSVPKFKNLGRLYSYTGACQTYTPILAGYKYQMECWGASGGEGNTTNGKGSYVSGTISNMKDIDFYVFVGQQGVTTNNTGAWNGGGKKGTETEDGSGGGATDIRTKEGLNSAQQSSWTFEWKDMYGLRGRILVAAGGGGSDDGAPSTNNCSGGGLNSNATLYGGSFTNATQTAFSTHTLNGEFGAGNQSYLKQCAGGGGGYWGGSGSDYGGTGGSSYISGHPGCIAIESAASTSAKSGTANTVAKATHYSGLYFTNTKMIDGTGHVWTTDIGSLEAMPNPTTVSSLYGSGVGNRGNGYSRITCMPYD